MKIKIEKNGRLIIEIQTVIRVPISLECGMSLSLRAEQCLKLLVAGKANKEIADEMCISQSTVKMHVSTLLKRFKCKTRGEIRRLVGEAGTAVFEQHL
jgi:DNA-binding CsgD family transcriptional regulator